MRCSCGGLIPRLRLKQSSRARRNSGTLTLTRYRKPGLVPLRGGRPLEDLSERVDDPSVGITESYAGGPRALVRDGDIIEPDVNARRLDLLVDDDELDRRRGELAPRDRAH